MPKIFYKKWLKSLALDTGIHTKKVVLSILISKSFHNVKYWGMGIN